MYPQSLDPVQEVDFAFYFILGISVVLLIGITVVALWFTYRYHHSRNPEPTNISGHVGAEIAWTLIPTLVVMAMFYYGWSGFKALRTVPDDAMQVHVTGRMFAWSFEYPNGKRSNVLFVPAGRSVKLNLTAADVLHSFYVPAFRIKMDTVPGMGTYAWFRSDKEGSYDVFCAEYCGVKHANMITTIEVVEPEVYEMWVNDKGDAQNKARALFENYGCTACHSLDGTDGLGPTLKDLYGKKRLVILPDGTEKEVVAEEKYLKKAILQPLEELVKGYDPVMAVYEDVIPDEDLEVMLAWLSGSMVSLSEGRELLQEQGCLSCHSTDGSIVAGPSFRGIWGRKVVVDRDGKRLELDSTRDYLVRAIVEPQYEVVEDWDPIMPAYTNLNDKQVDLMLEYMKSLDPGAGVSSE